MQRMRTLLLALGVTLPLAGCYYDPDYGYVRNGSGGDAYYGTETTTTVVEPGYYDPGFADYGGYGYGFGPGCCYSTIGVGGVWYRDRYYRRDRDWHGHPPPGGWRGDRDHRPPPGGWRGGDHRPPPGGWSRGDGDHRPPGGWNRGDGDHRPPPGGWRGGGDRPSNRPTGGRPPGGWHGGGQRDGRRDGH